MKSRIAQLDPKSLEKYWHTCPAFVIELKSASDRAKVKEAKMREWLENGAELGWLLDPESRSVTIYRVNHPEETRSGIDLIAGECSGSGFERDRRSLWNPLG